MRTDKANALRDGTAGPAPGWGRSDLTIKLSKARLARLQAIAASLPPGSTPTAAIDRALEAVLESGGQAQRLDELEEALQQRMDALEAALEAAALERRAEAERFGAAMVALARGVEGLHALIASFGEQG